MKVLILMVIVSLGHCVNRSKYPKERALEMLDGEGYIQYKGRKVRSQIYNIPGGHCYHSDENLNGAYCQVNIDSCCYKKHNFVCWTSFPLNGGKDEGHCRRYKPHDRPLSFFFNGTTYDPVD